MGRVDDIREIIVFVSLSLPEEAKQGPYWPRDRIRRKNAEQHDLRFRNRQLQYDNSQQQRPEWLTIVEMYFLEAVISDAAHHESSQHVDQQQQSDVLIRRPFPAQEKLH